MRKTDSEADSHKTLIQTHARPIRVDLKNAI